MDECPPLVVGQALLETLGMGLGEHFTPAARHAWGAVYDTIAGVMKSAAEEAGSDHMFPLLHFSAHTCAVFVTVTTKYTDGIPKREFTSSQKVDEGTVFGPGRRRSGPLTRATRGCRCSASRCRRRWLPRWGGAA